MAQISPNQLKALLDSGLTMSQVERIAAKRGDSVPSPSLGGYIVKPFIGAALRAGQAGGALIAAGMGVPQDKLQKKIEESRVIKAPLLGTLAFEGQKPINTRRGQEQLIGQTAELASYGTPIGRFAGALKPYVGKTLGYATGLGVAGYGAEAGYNLQQGEPDALKPGLGTAIPAAIPIVGKGLSKVPGIANFTIAKGLGLTQDELTTILTKPKELQAAKESGLSRISLGNMIESRFSKLTEELSDSGKHYKAIRENPALGVNVGESPVKSTLARFGIGFDEGRLVLSPESPPLSGGDVSALERFVAQYGSEKRLSANAFMNTRKALDDLANWRRDPTKTDQLEKISRAIRHEYDTLGKAQIKGLKEADAFASPRLKEIGKLRSEYMQYVDGQWTLKDAALARLANAGNKGREQVLKRLENYVPGITQQIQLVKALEGIGSLSGPRTGTYTNAAMLLAGPAAAITTGNPLFALLSLLVAVPQVSIPILMAFGKAHGFSKSVIRGIVGKLVQGRAFTEREAMIFRQAVINHLNEISPGDQFVSSPLGQRALAYTKNYIKEPALGMSIKDVSKSPLTKEALKYKSAEEFVNSRKIAYHVTTEKASSLIDKQGIKAPSGTRFRYGKEEPIPNDVYLWPDKKMADQFAKLLQEDGTKTITKEVDITGLKLRKDPEALGDFILGAKGNGLIFNGTIPAERILTKSQLIDLWKKAHGVADSIRKSNGGYPTISPELQAVQDRFRSFKDFTDPVKTPLKDGKYAILTAENPMGRAATAAENAAANSRLEADLRAAGYDPIPVKGHYGGNPEHSFIVPGLSRTKAISYGTKYNQESVLTKEGLNYKDGTVNPADTSKINFGGDQTDFYTEVTIGGRKVKFSIPIDFDTVVPFESTVKMPAKTELTKILTVDAPKAKEFVDTVAEKISKSNPDVLSATAPLKSLQSLIRKLKEEKNGELSAVHDIARNTLVGLNDKAVAKTLQNLKARNDTVSVLTQTPEVFSGYSGNLVKIKAPNGHVAEIQVTTPEMFYGKMLPQDSVRILGQRMVDAIRKSSGVEPGIGHQIYEQMRAIDKYDPVEYTKYLELDKQSREYYRHLQ